MSSLSPGQSPLYRPDVATVDFPAAVAPATRWGMLAANLKKLLHDVVADPLGVDPNKSGPVGLINPSGIFKGAIVGLLTMLGSWGGLALVWGWTHFGAVLLPPPVFLALTFAFGLAVKLWHLFGHGPAPTPVPTPARI